MAYCCTTYATPTTPCPRCGQVGPVVGAGRPWQYCPSVGCDVVFHLDDTTIAAKGLRTSETVAAP